jgi:hypothetical protein
MSIVINTREGLCNQLRTMFSYIELTQKFKIKLKVIWTNYNKCNGFFLDYFEPIPNVIIEEYTLNNINRIHDIKYKKNTPILSIKDIIKKSKTTENLVYRGYFPHPFFDPEKMFIYNLLKLNKNLKNKIKENIIKKKCHFISVHIRKTDLDILHNIEKSTNTSDTDFIDFANQYPKLDIYLATDNYQTQQKFIQLFPKRVFYNKLIDNKINKHRFITHRETSLENAIIDLYTCVKSKNFKGTYKSSFSRLIQQLRDK